MRCMRGNVRSRQRRLCPPSNAFANSNTASHANVDQHTTANRVTLANDTAFADPDVDGHSDAIAHPDIDVDAVADADGPGRALAAPVQPPSGPHDHVDSSLCPRALR